MREFGLPISGKTVTIRRGKGRDLITTQKMVYEPEETVAALISILCTFDG